MCLPLIGAALGAIGSALAPAAAWATSAAGAATLGVASAGASFIQQAVTANSQNKAITDQLAQGQEQVKEQQASQLEQRQREGWKEQGRMQVAAGEAGLQLSSGSIESMLMDSQMQTSLDGGNINLNAEHQDQNLASEAGRYYSMVNNPSIIGSGLRLISSGLSGFNSGTANALKKNTISTNAANQAS